MANKPWYAGEHQDALFYLLIAIFFIELAVGGIAFFYGIVHAVPEMEGGPPVARFPWLAWALAAILTPVGLILIVHLAGSWLSQTLNREVASENEVEPDKNHASPEQEQLPAGLKRFYASVKHAPTVVLLVSILLIGALLFFMDGALAALGRFGTALIPYIPWLCGSIGGLLLLCFLIHAFMVFRQRKMEQEYAWRREVLEKTGLVLVDKASVSLPQNDQNLLKKAIASDQYFPKQNILDVEALPEAASNDKSHNNNSETGKKDVSTP